MNLAWCIFDIWTLTDAIGGAGLGAAAGDAAARLELYPSVTPPPEPTGKTLTLPPCLIHIR